MAEDFRRLIDGAHRLHDAEHGGDDAERREAVADRDELVIGFELVMTDRLDFFVHQGFDLMGPRVAHDDQPEIIADERRQLLFEMTVGERLKLPRHSARR